MFFNKSYKLTSQETDDAREILARYGIGQEDQIDRFFSLERVDSQVIPELFIDGTQIGYPGFYLKKLDILSVQGAAYAACLYNITSPFHVRYFITDSVVHGISSPNGGFYVLYRQDEDTPKLEDSVMAHAWVWQGDSGALCLETINVTQNVNVALIKDMFRYLGHILCAQYDVPYVNTGKFYPSSDSPAFLNFPVSTIHSLDHNRSVDAGEKQFLLAHKEMPFLLFGKVQTPELKSIITSESELFLADLFQYIGALKDHERLQRIIALMIHAGRDNRNDPFFQSLLDAAGQRKEELRSLINANRRYITELNNQNTMNTHQNIEFSAIQDGAYINAVNAVGRSALHMAIYNTANNAKTRGNDIGQVQQVIELGIDLNIQEKFRNRTALMLTLDTVLYDLRIKTGREIAMLLIKSGANLELKNESGTTPLIAATKNDDLEMVQTLVGMGAKIENCDAGLKTAVFWAAELGRLKIFDYLQAQGAALNIICTAQRNTLLIAAVQRSPQLNDEILSRIMAQEGVDTQHKNSEGNTVLHEAAQESDYLHILSPFYSDIEWYDAIKEQNQDGDTVLHRAVDNSFSLKLILQRYKEEPILKVVTIPNKAGDTPLHKSAEKPLSLSAMLTPLLPNERANAINVPNKKGHTVLYLALNNHETLKVISNLLTSDQLFAAITKRNAKGDTLLHRAIYYPESLKLIWKCLTEDQRIEASQILKTFLFIIVGDPVSIRAVLELFPENQRFDAVKLTDSDGKTTVLDRAAYHVESLKEILTLLPEEQRLEFLRMTIKGKSVAKYIIKNPPIPTIENSYAEQYLKIYSHFVKPGKNQKFNFFNKDSLLLFRYLIDSSITFDDVKKLVPEDWQKQRNFEGQIKSTLFAKLKDEQDHAYESVEHGLLSLSKT
ncbi:MAG: ankyrin repeat domain-containing protein [Legionella sp.]|nr:ankyrin repeat domain-containing protein [Legionella sp.]